MKVYYEEQDVRKMMATASKSEQIMLILLKQRFQRVDGDTHEEYKLLSRPETIKFISVLKATHEIVHKEVEKGEMSSYHLDRNEEYQQEHDDAITKVVNGQKIEGYNPKIYRESFQPDADSLRAARAGNMSFVKEIEMFSELQGILQWEAFYESSRKATLPGVHEKRLMDPSIIFFSAMQHMRYGNPLRDESAAYWNSLKTLSKDELISHMFMPGAIKVMSGSMSSEQRKACYEVVRSALKARIRVLYLSCIGLAETPRYMSESFDTERFMLEIQLCNMILEVFS